MGRSYKLFGIQLFFVIGILILSILQNAYSYESSPNAPKSPVHQYISQQAKDLWPQIDAEIIQHLGTNILTSLDESGFQTGEDVIIGSGEEDTERWFFCSRISCILYPVDPETCAVIQTIGDEYVNRPYQYHFWDPDMVNTGNGFYNEGWTIGSHLGDVPEWATRTILFAMCPTYPFPQNETLDSNFRWALSLWNSKVIRKYHAGDKEEAYYWLGRVAHLLQDLTVPAHVHNDTHLPFVGFSDLYEEFTKSRCDAYQEGNIFNAQHFKGQNYVDRYYRYEELPNWPDSKWKGVYIPNVPPSNLFKLFWYTAQKTQYYASSEVAGNNHYSTYNGEQIVFSPSLWNGENVSIVNNPVNLDTGSQITCSSETLNILNRAVDGALIPHAMEATAGLYRLFWVETHVGKGAPDDLLRQKFLQAYLGPSAMDFPVNDVDLWGKYWVQHFPDTAGFGKSIMIYNFNPNYSPKQDSVYIVHGDIWNLFKTLCDVRNGNCSGKSNDLKGPNSWLGPPISNEESYPVSDSPSNVRQRFENGYITHLSGSDPYWQAYPYDIIPPTISITSPADKSSINATTTVSVSINDNVGVTNVKYFLDNSDVIAYSSYSFPFNWSWNTTNVSNGLHKITARAYDAGRNQSLPSTVTVAVNNSAGNNPPNIPTSLTQYKSDGIAGIPLGGTTNERTVVMKGGVTDPDNDAVSLEVEVKPVGTDFANAPSPNCISGGTVASGGTGIGTCSGLSDGQYHWQARAKDNSGTVSGWLSAGGNLESVPDFIVSAGSITVNYPPVVNLISPIGGEMWTVGNSYNIRWTASDNTGTVQYVNIYFSVDSGAAWPYTVSSNRSNDGIFPWTPSVSTTKGRIKVEAVDSYGEKSFSISGSDFTVLSSCAAPSIPVLQSITPSGNGYNVTWTASNGVIFYNLQQDVTPSFSNPSVVYSGSGRSWYSGEKLPGAYYYRVKAVNNCTESEWSNIQSVTILGNQGPGAISAINPPDGATNQPRNVTLSWSASHPGGENLRFNVYVCQCDTTGFFTNNIKSYGQTSMSFNLYNLPFNTTISWGIEAIDDTGDTRFSPMFHFTTIGDTSRPTGSILINNGAATTTSYSVTLNLSASDTDSGVKYMKFSNDGTHWTNWELFGSEYAWNLTDWNYGGQFGLSSYTVYAQFRDYESNESEIYSDSITKVSGAPGDIILRGQIYQTIQEALNTASHGDMVYLTGGVYELPGNVIPTNYPDRSVGIQMKPGVTLMGAGPEKTVIEVLDTAFAGIVDADNSVIEGITIINAGGLTWRYGVLLESSASELRNCIIKGGGTGIYIGHGLTGVDCKISNNVIMNNSQSGIWLSKGNNISIYNNTIVNNNVSGGYGGFFGYLGSAKMINNIVMKSVVGIRSYNAPFIFQNNDVYDNNNVNNTGANYTGVQDQTGVNGNISSNPSFLNYSSGDYHLGVGSPCINTGTNVGIPFEGGAPDMGAYEYNGTGTIQVTSNRVDASFTVIGPSESYSGTGTNWSRSNVPVGIYIITFTPITNLYSPPYQAKMLYSGQTITFDGTHLMDTIGPSGKITLNFDEYATADKLVTITFDLTDEVGGLGVGSQMMFSNDGQTWSVAEPYLSIKKDWDLTLYGGNASSGVKTVFGKVSDSLGNWTALTDTILYVPNRQVLEIPTQYSTIQAGIDAAQDGDVVYVLPGSYDGNISLKEGVRLQGAGADKTSIYIVSPGRNSMVDGFAFGNLGGNAIDTSNITGFILSNCLIPGTRTIRFGPNSKVIIRNNVINTSWMGFYLLQVSEVSLENNTFAGTSFTYGSSPTIAIDVNGSTPDTKIYLRGNLITNYGIGIVDYNTGDTEHRHIFASFNSYWNNSYGNFGESDSYYSRANIYKAMGPGDMNADPMFVDLANKEFHLKPGSPAINSGIPEERYNDPDGTRNDRGSYGGPSLNTPPKPDFSIDPPKGGVGTIFTMDASLSHDGETKDERLQVRWDVDGDGVFDTNFSAEKMLTHNFGTPGTYNVKLQVKDEKGFMSATSKPVEVINEAPNVPSNPTPMHRSTGQLVNVTLSWNGGDPSPEDLVRYDVYFGRSNNPPIISCGQNSTYFNPGILDYSTVYYWKVVSSDSFGIISEGPLWYFVTGERDPSISFSPLNINLSAESGGPNPSSQSFSVWNSGGATLNWSVDDNATWLNLSPTNGTSSGIISVSVDTAGLTAGTYNAVVTITGAGAINSPQTLPVNLIVISPSETTGPSLSITSHSNGQHVSTASITIAGTASDSGRGDNGIQQVTVNGLRASNDTATGSGTANWSSPLTLTNGVNTITVIAYDNSSNHNQTSLSITIYYDAPTETVSVPGTPTGPTSGDVGSSYSYITTGSTSSLGDPVEYQFDWKGDGTVVSSWGAANRSNSWPNPGTYFVRVRARCSLHPSIVSFWSPTLTVRILPPPPPVDNPPFGSFDIPLPSATISGPIQVGGWALDDVGVTKVELRSDIPFWPYIGDLYYTCGARPDVKSTYPNYPNNDCAGWGYVWLTNFMSDYRDPQAGQRVLEGSTHQYYLRIYDTTGHFVDVGHRNITIRNDQNANPFGAIDGPSPGAIVSGSVNVVGWALARGGQRVSRVRIALGGQVLGEANYGLYRADVEAAFPGYADSGGSGLVYVLDTTLYPNGMYELIGVVTDDGNHQDGIGSRWIYIQN